MTDLVLINTVAPTAIPPAYKVVYGSRPGIAGDVVKFADNLAAAKTLGREMLKAARDQFSERAWRPFQSVTGDHFERQTAVGGIVIIYDQAFLNEMRSSTLK